MDQASGSVVLSWHGHRDTSRCFAIGQIGITVSPNVKSIFFIMFLFAVG